MENKLCTVLYSYKQDRNNGLPTHVTVGKVCKMHIQTLYTDQQYKNIQHSAPHMYDHLQSLISIITIHQQSFVNCVARHNGYNVTSMLKRLQITLLVITLHATTLDKLFTPML